MTSPILLVALAISWVIRIYLLVLIARVIIDWIGFFTSNQRPPAPLMVVANLVYRLTDPPLDALRRVIPPARIGSVSLDVGFIVLFFGLSILRSIVWYVAYMLV